MNKTSRFIVMNDDRVDKMIYNIPNYWWSRPYEYAWASQFAGENDIVLDAACGMSHHFKFNLADFCEEVYACDFDERILYNQQIRQEVFNDHGQVAVDAIDKGDYLSRIAFSQADITQMPYDSKVFDKIFCISVIEHLDSNETKLATLKEFARVLKDDGLIVLTFDYPDTTPEIFTELIHKAGLEYVSHYIPQASRSAITNGNLLCFRALLRKV